MKLIVGLGNPGSRYEGTRHNAGKMAAEFFARSRGLKFSKKTSLQASIASGDDFLVATPETFVNQSGESVARLVRHFEIKPEKDLLIILDDVALPFGKLRLRSQGSDGGHNGLKSVASCLNSTSYARLRMGIAGEDPIPVSGNDDPLASYVLSSFSSSEKKLIPELLNRTSKACEAWLAQSVQSAMNVVNDGNKKS